VVIASLARAGTPIGVLLLRTLRAQGVPAVHYSISIIRDRGIDRVARTISLRATILPMWSSSMDGPARARSPASFAAALPKAISASPHSSRAR
jgi:hypothetical protein